LGVAAPGGLILELPPEAADVKISRQVYRDRIMRDVDSGRRSGVWRAPTLFVDDVRVDATPSLPGLLPALDRALSAAGAEPGDGGNTQTDCAFVAARCAHPTGVEVSGAASATFGVGGPPVNTETPTWHALDSILCARPCPFDA
jgi:hypothetical protein